MQSNLQDILQSPELQKPFNNGCMSVSYSIVEWRIIFIASCVQQGSSGDQHLHNWQVALVTCFMLKQEINSQESFWSIISVKKQILNYTASTV